MSRDPLLDHAIEVTDEHQVVGYGLLRCELCPEPVPLPVLLFVTKDEDGDDVVLADPDTTDLEAHMLTHAVTDTEVT